MLNSFPAINKDQYRILIMILEGKVHNSLWQVVES